MKTMTRTVFRAVAALWMATATMGAAQDEKPADDPPPPDPPAAPAAEEGDPFTGDDASLTAEVGEEGGRIVVEAKGLRPKVPVFFAATADQQVTVGLERLDYEAALGIRIVQGKPSTLSLGIGGEGVVDRVTGEGLLAWAVRRVGGKRFLDLQVDPKGERREFRFVMAGKLLDLELPREVDLLHLRPGQAVGFSSTVKVVLPGDVAGRLLEAEGFLPLESGSDAVRHFQNIDGRRLAFRFSRSSAVAAPVELDIAALNGVIDEKLGHATFELRGTATVSEDESAIDILRGRAAVEALPDGAGWRLDLATDRRGNPVYRLHFDKAGRFEVNLKIVARLMQRPEFSAFEFEIPSGAVVPVVIRGIGADTEFSDTGAVVPTRTDGAWKGFLPVNGQCAMGWRPKRLAGEGKLFFNTVARTNVGVGAGLMRQTTDVDFKILQGKLEAIRMALAGPGEVLAVEGPNVLSWKVTEAGGSRFLEIALNQPIEGTSNVRVRSQLALGAFPVRAAPLRVLPEGSTRHSGFVRVYNIGATRLEVAGVEGMTQLSPAQFPDKQATGGDRQVFVYRFPAAEHAYEIAADRVQPEVNVSQVVIYELSETDRVIRADVELDIREAPLREWEIEIPEDYSVVSVSGADVADNQVGTQVADGRRSLMVIFGSDVSGRRLVRVHLEKNQPAEDGEWALPRLRYPAANSVRGEIGAASVPGFRMSVGTVEMLTEIPLSRFQNNQPNLQQAFRIREEEWSAGMIIEKLPQSVQADVFHLYSLKDQTAYASVVLNYFITGAPVTEWNLGVPKEAGNVAVEGRDVRTWRREEGELADRLIVSLNQAVVGSYTLLVTYEEAVGANGGSIRPGRVAPEGVRGERGFIHVVSPVQVDVSVAAASPELLKLDPLELPAEFRLLSAAPALATYQYTARGFDLALGVEWFEPGDTIEQVVEFAEAESRVSRDGEVVTDVTYFVKSRGRRVLRAKLPGEARLWEVSVDGRAVSARVDGAYTLIPLPAGADANVPVQVSLRLGRPAASGSLAVLTLPAVAAPVLKTEWEMRGEQGRVLVPKTDGIPIANPVLTETGLEWIANRAVGPTLALTLVLAFACWLRRTDPAGAMRAAGGIALLVVGLVLALMLMRHAQLHSRSNLEVLDVTLPAVAADQQVSIVVGNYKEWRVALNYAGLAAIAAGIGLFVWSFFARKRREIFRLTGVALVPLGILAQRGGAWTFYLLAALAIAILLLPWIGRGVRNGAGAWRERRAERARRKLEERERAGEGPGEPPPMPGPSAASLLILGLVLALGGAHEAMAKTPPAKEAPAPVVPAGMAAADAIVQSWVVAEGRVKATGSITVTGREGESFLLLKEPAVLTDFTGDGLRIDKQAVAGCGTAFVVSIRGPGGAAAPGAEPAVKSLRANFAFEMQVGEDARKWTVPTGPAAVQDVGVLYDKAGWEFESGEAMRIVPVVNAGEGQSGARLLLAPSRVSTITLQPKSRDVKAEETQFYVEVSNLYLPSPGVVDGRHAIRVRPSQGEVRELALKVPEGFTVSDVGQGPVSTWQFDAEAGRLIIAIEPPQANPFMVLVETEGSLGALPADIALAPVTVEGAAGEVGLAALAFGSEAQPENPRADGMSVVNLADFEAALIPEREGGKPVLHRVYRYGQAGGTIALRVAPVAPEVRVTSTQVLSIGDERLVLGVNFNVDILRAGVFQLSFPLPDGLEVDSLTGPALSHWTELTDDGRRHVIMHLNGKTIGTQQFSLALSGPSPGVDGEGWLVPRFEVREASRQTGDLVVKPTTGIRLRTLLRRNVSEVDPRQLGGEGDGALAFRILQSDWELRLGIEKLDPWLTGLVLHDLTLREGQTRTGISAQLQVENASIRTLRVRLPGMSEEEARTVRATGTAVNDMVRVPSADDPAVAGDLWEIQFKRRMIGDVPVRIEYERTGERAEGLETLRAAEFPDLRQSSYYFAVRAGARMELETGDLPKGWQRVDWNAVPQ
ncbi:MAG: hypothetical protein HKO57_13745, partial [Akkermansiaceae bacterium]|nr:hypothetical protein [Akkermansiaceae bacterium]